jgi:hypothetical protein
MWVCQLFLSDVNEICNVSTNFNKIPHCKILMKIPSAVLDLLHSDSKETWRTYKSIVATLSPKYDCICIISNVGCLISEF